MVFNCSITKNDADLSRRFNKKWKLLPFKVYNYPVYVDTRFPRMRTIYVYDKTEQQQICRLELHPVLWDGVACYNVDCVYVDPAYQGKKIALNLYRSLITKYKINLLTVGYHSPGAKKLWNDLATFDNISAYGIRADGKSVWRCQSDNKRRKLRSLGKNPSVYSNKEGIGILLTKTNSVADNYLAKRVKRKSKAVDVLESPGYEFYATIYA